MVKKQTSPSTLVQSSSYILDDDVVQMLEKLELTQHKNTFMKEELNMDDIRRMDDANLKSIGIEMFKHRRDIMEAASVYETRKTSASTKHITDTSSSSISKPITRGLESYYPIISKSQ